MSSSSCCSSAIESQAARGHHGQSVRKSVRRHLWLARLPGCPTGNGQRSREGPPSTLQGAMHVRSYAQIEPFVTLDGSEIREWAGRVAAPAQNQSLAEATVPTGSATTEHYHRLSEELYLVSAGEGRLIIDGEERIIGEGDCALI